MESKRGHMDIGDRAKQFMPFDALRGFREVLKEKEKIVVPKIELSEYAKEQLDIKFKHIEKGSMISVVYFHNDEYIKVTGLVSRLDITSKIIVIVNKKIRFEDIYEVIEE